jgi:Fe-Mn family superoxide dismutase
MAEYVLPDLPYDYSALAPHISPQIMELHHDKHHATYVKGLNTALEQLAEARDSNSFGSIGGLERALAFNLGGHINHSVFWKNLSPDGGGEPEGVLADAITEFFGSFDKFKAHFEANALGILGSGWSMLVFDALGQRLNIVQVYDQQGNVPVGQIPLVTLDMWEHAFYLDYKNVKPDYVKAWWNVVNWTDATQRYNVAVSQSIGLLGS